MGGGCVASRDRGRVHAVHPRADGCVLAAGGGRSIAVGGGVAWADCHACVSGGGRCRTESYRVMPGHCKAQVVMHPAAHTI